MKKIFAHLATLIFFLTAGLHPAFATLTPQCQPIYGGGQTCIQNSDFSLNKFVKNPATNGYVENLGVNDIKFTSSQEVFFKITIKNMSSKTISNIKVIDTFPQYLDFASGTGSFDKSKQTFTFSIPSLAVKEQKVFFFSGKVVPQNNLPKGMPTLCPINLAEATANNKTSQDNTQFCIQTIAANPTEIPIPRIQLLTNPPTTKGGLPVYPPTQTRTTPPTGPEALALISLLPIGGFGMWLKRKAK